uniref:Molybdopterin and thiamine biosynthesis protein n=1 Tax=Clostridium botulinum TaxID=1491 RepID=A0A0A0UTK6_CLOBO|nr:molybdopterin and thiamine biosynthesis protein [Clostridium botulinum]AIW54751.1 molybdopterin and thiamine biosynthesis protein [Clostridium botulinum]AIW54820.1 molybdopterin and thiamine biosynthesis protein [Clostridium botulinum]AIW54881.1 molybdopterin and thiamine biosynthesis protein [Clostridium botulinum]
MDVWLKIHSLKKRILQMRDLENFKLFVQQSRRGVTVQFIDNNISETVIREKVLIENLTEEITNIKKLK